MLLRPLGRRSLAGLDAVEDKEGLTVAGSEGCGAALAWITNAEFHLIVVLLVNGQARPIPISASPATFVYSMKE
jgi:hypothetical protein